MAFAARTKVHVNTTRAEIETMLTRHKATTIATMVEADKAIVLFRMKDRHIRFTLPLDGSEQARRSRWRALALCIKAKLESIASGIEQFDEAFLGQIVTADGATVYHRTHAALAEEYRLGKVQPLMLTRPSQ